MESKKLEPSVEITLTELDCHIQITRMVLPGNVLRLLLTSTSSTFWLWQKIMHGLYFCWKLNLSVLIIHFLIFYILIDATAPHKYTNSDLSIRIRQ